MPSSSSPLLHVTAHFGEIERLVREANELATKCPEVTELLVNVTGRNAREILADSDACAQLRYACQAYLKMLDAVTASPFTKLAHSRKVMAELKRKGI